MNERSLTTFRCQKPLLLAVIIETDEGTEQKPKLKLNSKLDRTQGYASVCLSVSHTCLYCVEVEVQGPFSRWGSNKDPEP